MIKTTNTVKTLAVISSCLGIVMKIKKNTDSSQIVTRFVQLPTQPALISGLFSLMYQQVPPAEQLRFSFRFVMFHSHRNHYPKTPSFFDTVTQGSTLPYLQLCPSSHSITQQFSMSYLTYNISIYSVGIFGVYWVCIKFYARCCNTLNDQTHLIPASEFLSLKFLLSLASILSTLHGYDLLSFYSVGHCTGYFTYALAFNHLKNL